MDLDLAEECFRDKLVTSVALRDDIVARFSPEALAGLLQDLESFNLDDALEEVRLANLLKLSSADFF